MRSSVRSSSFRAWPAVSSPGAARRRHRRTRAPPETAAPATRPAGALRAPPAAATRPAGKPAPAPRAPPAAPATRPARAPRAARNRHRRHGRPGLRLRPDQPRQGGGWICDLTQPYAIQGAWYGYGDGTSCPASTPNPCSTGSCRMMGTTAPPDTTYMRWGCGVGMELSSSGGTAPTKASTRALRNASSSRSRVVAAATSSASASRKVRRHRREPWRPSRSIRPSRTA